MRDDEEKTPLIDTITARQETNPEEIFLSREYAQQLEVRLEESLSDLEKRVLYLHLRGTDYKTIAKLLDKSPKTVDNALSEDQGKDPEDPGERKRVKNPKFIIDQTSTTYCILSMLHMTDMRAAVGSVR